MSARITRRTFLGAAAGAVCASAAGGRVRAARARGPHILLLMADQFRADCVGADGNSAIHTPNLDTLAMDGVLFNRAYSCTPTCTPARAALLTGLAPWRHGMLGYGRVAEKYPVEMPQVLRDAGYYTSGIGKMHWHPQRNKHGFHNVLLDESGRAEFPEFRSDYRAWFMHEAPLLDPDATGIGWNDYAAAPYKLPERLHPTAWTGDCAVNFISQYDRQEPFFLKVSFSRPHSPYDPPERFWRMYEDAPLPQASVGKWAERYAQRNGDKSDIWCGALGAEQVRCSKQGYYGSVSFVDEQIGRLLEALDRRGWMEETLIIFTADHGDMTGDHNLWRKSYAYESSARIPMLVRGPHGLVGERGQICARPVELRDVLPTFMDAAEANGRETLDGRSLLSLTRDAKSDWRPYIDLEHDVCYLPELHWNALTDGEWKYIFHARDGQEQLFDLKRDPRELNDLAGDARYAGKMRKWRRRLVAHLEERGEPFVKNGDLAPRPESCLYSPNYPGCSCHTKA